MGQLDTVLTGLVRLQNSPDGNPRWDIFTQHGTYRTANDADSGYQVQNMEPGIYVGLDLNSQCQVLKIKEKVYRG